jgi:hypothetical protein
MDDMPCRQCTGLIGASSSENPHALLKRMKYRRNDDAIAAVQAAEFYQCNLCHSLLVRESIAPGRDAKWDWI